MTPVKKALELDLYAALGTILFFPLPTRINVQCHFFARNATIRLLLMRTTSDALEAPEMMGAEEVRFIVIRTHFVAELHCE